MPNELVSRCVGSPDFLPTIYWRLSTVLAPSTISDGASRPTPIVTHADHSGIAGRFVQGPSQDADGLLREIRSPRG